MKIVLGLDPGFARVGYGVLSKERSFNVLDFGCITTSKNDCFPERLCQIKKDLRKIIKQYHPTVASIESLFFAKNSKTAMAVAAARGVLILTVKEAGLDVFEYTPLQIKQAVVGYGRADKNQVLKMVTTILGLQKCSMLDDASDALAASLCHFNSRL
jgi:crossover junction endodeoxyribonuclease RuvC